MSFTAQLGSDFLSVDGLEAVTIERTDAAPATPIAHALRRATTTAEADNSNGKYTASDLVWHLPTAELPESPRLGDRIVDAQTTGWTVLEVESCTLANRWRCRTRNLAIVAGLSQQITIQRASWSQASDGAPVATWTDWRINVPARVQPVNEMSEDAESRTRARHRLQVYLAEPVMLDHNFRIVDGTAIFRILGSERAELLDQFMTLTVERITPVEV